MDMDPPYCILVLRYLMFCLENSLQFSENTMQTITTANYMPVGSIRLMEGAAI